MVHIMERRPRPPPLEIALASDVSEQWPMLFLPHRLSLPPTEASQSRRGSAETVQSSNALSSVPSMALTPTHSLPAVEPLYNTLSSPGVGVLGWAVQSAAQAFVFGWGMSARAAQGLTSLAGMPLGVLRNAVCLGTAGMAVMQGQHRSLGIPRFEIQTSCFGF
jgi:hypothetical protein